MKESNYARAYRRQQADTVAGEIRKAYGKKVYIAYLLTESGWCMTLAADKKTRSFYYEPHHVSQAFYFRDHGWSFEEFVASIARPTR